MPASKGSTSEKNASQGNPPREAFQSHLWPMAQMLRDTREESRCPVRTAATISQCSRAVPRFLRLSGLLRNQCRSLAKPHSEEYTPPHQSICLTPFVRATEVIRAASRQER